MIGFLNVFGVGEKLHLPRSVCPSAALKAHPWGTQSCSGGQWKLGKIKVIKELQINNAFILDLLTILASHRVSRKTEEAEAEMNPHPTKRPQIGCRYKSSGSHRVFEAWWNNVIIFESRGEDKLRTVCCFSEFCEGACRIQMWNRSQQVQEALIQGSMIEMNQQTVDGSSLLLTEMKLLQHNPALIIQEEESSVSRLTDTTHSSMLTSVFYAVKTQWLKRAKLTLYFWVESAEEEVFRSFTEVKVLSVCKYDQENVLQVRVLYDCC